MYPTSPTAANLTTLVETNAKVNTVNFGGGGVMQDITTHQWQVWPKTNDSPACWYYTCLYDATDLVKQPVEDAIKTSGSGTYTFTLGHASTVVGPPTSKLRPGFPRIPNAPSSDHTSGYSFTLYNSSGSPTSNYTGYPLGTPATILPGGTCECIDLGTIQCFLCRLVAGYHLLHPRYERAPVVSLRYIQPQF